MSDFHILHGDALTALYTLPTGSVQCVVTSPPYWGLRDYGTARWVGGDASCDHKADRSNGIGSSTLGGGKKTTNHQQEGYRGVCGKCGAQRVDSQIGLEATPAEYVAHLVEVFREVKRVLRADGTLWLNLGDSYNGSGGAGGDYATGGLKDGQPRYPGRNSACLKPKDLCGIPWRVAFALQDDGWYLRADCIWAKPNPMPESVTDRPTKAHEYVFLLSKRERYFYDAEAIAEPVTTSTLERLGQPTLAEQAGSARANGGAKTNGRMKAVPPRFGGSKYGDSDAEETRTKSGNAYELVDGRRNARSVWTIATQPFNGAHFATMPPKLAETCIKAGTSARGCCPACGAPWRRVIEKANAAPESWHGSKFDDGKNLENHPNIGRREDATTATQYADGTTAKRLALLRQQARENGGEYVNSARTTGWQPTCTCPPAEPIPCTVLDPFLGSGTTVAVAVGLGRHGIGIELNANYIELAEQRIAKVQRPLPLTV